MTLLVQGDPQAPVIAQMAGFSLDPDSALGASCSVAAISDGWPPGPSSALSFANSSSTALFGAELL
jgi:hypothetical protein